MRMTPTAVIFVLMHIYKTGSKKRRKLLTTDGQTLPHDVDFYKSWDKNSKVLRRFQYVFYARAIFSLDPTSETYQKSTVVLNPRTNLRSLCVHAMAFALLSILAWLRDYYERKTQLRDSTMPYRAMESKICRVRLIVVLKWPFACVHRVKMLQTRKSTWWDRNTAQTNAETTHMANMKHSKRLTLLEIVQMPPNRRSWVRHCCRRDAVPNCVASGCGFEGEPARLLLSYTVWIWENDCHHRVK